LQGELKIRTHKTQKARRDSGRTEANSTLLHEMKKSDIIARCLEPQEFWDDWKDYRDGNRDTLRDGKKIKLNDVILFGRYLSSYAWEDYLKRKLRNHKNKKLLQIRKAKKVKIIEKAN